MAKVDPEEVWALLQKIDAISEGSSLSVRLGAFATAIADVIIDVPKERRAALVVTVVRIIEETIEFVGEKIDG